MNYIASKNPPAGLLELSDSGQWHLVELVERSLHDAEVGRTG